MALGGESEGEDRRTGFDERMTEAGVARAPDDEGEADEAGRQPDAQPDQHHHGFEGREDVVAPLEVPYPAHPPVHEEADLA